MRHSHWGMAVACKEESLCNNSANIASRANCSTDCSVCTSADEWHHTIVRTAIQTGCLTMYLPSWWWQPGFIAFGCNTQLHAPLIYHEPIHLCMLLCMSLSSLTHTCNYCLSLDQYVCEYGCVLCGYLSHISIEKVTSPLPCAVLVYSFKTVFATLKIQNCASIQVQFGTVPGKHVSVCRKRYATEGAHTDFHNRLAMHLCTTLMVHISIDRKASSQKLKNQSKQVRAIA